MSNTNTGGPAFPIQGHSTRNGQGFQLVMADGMTLRDYFAAKAMQGLLANPKLHEQILRHGGANGRWIELSAYGWADAMLKAREA